MEEEMFEALLKALSRFVNGDLPDLDVFVTSVLSDPYLRIDPDAPIREFGSENQTKLRGDNVSILYFWTKKGEDQAETIEVKLIGRRGIFTATLTNNRLVELTLNGGRVPKSRLSSYQARVQQILSRVRMLEQG